MWAMRTASGSPVSRPAQGLGEGAGGQGHRGGTAAGAKCLDSGVVSRAGGWVWGGGDDSGTPLGVWSEHRGDGDSALTTAPCCTCHLRSVS